MRKVRSAIAILAIAGLVTSALAQQEKKQRRGKLEKVTGTFVSATVENGTVTVKINIDDGEKTYEMSATVVAICREKNGEKLARMIRVSRGGKAPQPKGNMQVVQGDIQSAVLQGNKVIVTIKPAEGEATTVSLTARINVLCREGKAVGIASAGGAKRRKAEGAAKPRRKKKGADAPQNL